MNISGQFFCILQALDYPLHINRLQDPPILDKEIRVLPGVNTIIIPGLGKIQYQSGLQLSYVKFDHIIFPE